MPGVQNAPGFVFSITKDCEKCENCIHPHLHTFEESANCAVPEHHEIDSKIIQRNDEKFALLAFDGCPPLLYTYNIKLIIYYPFRKEVY